MQVALFINMSHSWGQLRLSLQQGGLSVYVLDMGSKSKKEKLPVLLRVRLRNGIQSLPLHSLGQSKSSKLTQTQEKGNKFHISTGGRWHTCTGMVGQQWWPAVFGDCLPQFCFFIISLLNQMLASPFINLQYPVFLFKF